MKRIATLAETSETLTTVRIIYDSVPFAATPLPWLYLFLSCSRSAIQNQIATQFRSLYRNDCPHFLLIQLLSDS
jgi:hypothetical protein